MHFSRLSLALLGITVFWPVHASEEKTIYGWIEKVIVSSQEKLLLEAKLDTGADNSSLDANVIKRFRRNGKRLVRFDIEDPATGKRVILERPYLRRVRIKRHDGNHQRRVVVPMELCLGDTLRKVEVSLMNREQFDYPVLLGRSALQGIAIVDPDLKLTRSPSCFQSNDKDNKNSDASTPSR